MGRQKRHKIAIHETLSEFSYRKDLVGWIKGDNVVNVGSLAEEIARLTKENSELQLRINKANQINSSMYGGLTFQELKSLLQTQFIEKDKNITLYAYLLSNGWNLISGMEAKDNSEALDQFCYLKIIKSKYSRDTNNDICTKYIFTDSGRNFFLKAYVLLMEKSKITS